MCNTPLQVMREPGNRVQLQNISWEMFETILDELGDRYAARLAYYKGTLEIRMPQPLHERAKSIIGYSDAKKSLHKQEVTSASLEQFQEVISSMNSECEQP